jgi:hypothetical protein
LINALLSVAFALAPACGRIMAPLPLSCGKDYVLVRGNRVTPVGHRAKPILDALDGRSTLRQIEERFGQKALDFVGSLYRKGFVELR